MNSQCEQPFQYRQIRSQSLSPYNDFILIKQLKRQLHHHPQKVVQQQSFEGKPNQEQIESNIISQDSTQYCYDIIKNRRSSLNIQSNSIPINQNNRYSLKNDQSNQKVPKIIVTRNLSSKFTQRKHRLSKPVNYNQILDDDTIQNTIFGQCNGSQDQTKKENDSILPQIKQSKILIVDQQPIKRKSRYEQLMVFKNKSIFTQKKTCEDQLIELQSLIKKIQKQPNNKKEKKVTFLA